MMRSLVGFVVGALTGAIVAVNVVIFSGMDQGYETSLPDVFRQSPVVGVVVVAVLVAGPVVGVVLARRSGSGRVVVSEATVDDIPAIATFFRDAWAMVGPDAPGWAGASEEVIEELTRPEVLAARVGGPDRRMFIAVVDGRVAGFSATRRDDDDTAELAGIVVLQDMVGRGIGTPLLDEALTALRSDGVERVVLKTEATNERAIGFYRARGFGEERRFVEDVEGIPTELVELSRQL